MGYRRPSKRDIAKMNNNAHRFYASLSDRAPMIEEVIPEKRERKTREDAPPSAPLEREVLKACWQYLSHHPKVAWVTRINSGGTYFSDGHGNDQFMRFNYKRGISDLIGQMKSGAFLAVECKREGASLEEHQRDFLNEVRAANGVAFVARCVEDCVKELG